MKWAFAIQQKIRASLLLAAIMFFIILTNLLERKNTSDLTQAVSSIYDDRLVPATDLFYITERIYEKRFVLEGFLAENNADTKKVALALNTSFDASRTLFRNEGKQSLTGLTKKLEELTTIQTNVGNELIKTSKGTLASSQTLSILQISFSIIIGIMVLALIFNWKITNTHQENFKWN